MLIFPAQNINSERSVFSPVYKTISCMERILHCWLFKSSTDKVVQIREMEKSCFAWPNLPDSHDYHMQKGPCHSQLLINPDHSVILAFFWACGSEEWGTKILWSSTINFPGSGKPQKPSLCFSKESILPLQWENQVWHCDSLRHGKRERTRWGWDASSLHASPKWIVRCTWKVKVWQSKSCADVI